MKIIRKISRLFGTKEPSYKRDYYYEKLVHKYKSVEAYLNLIQLQQKQEYLTDKDIVFSENPDFDKHHINHIRKRYGHPSYTIVNTYAFGKIKIRFYRIYLGNHKVKMELHFYKNALVMYNYTFSHLHNEGEKTEVLNLLKEKYHLDKSINLQQGNSYIKDQKESVIVLSQGIDFTINYVLHTDSHLFEQMKDAKKAEVEQGKQIPNHNKRHVFVNL